ncbi:MAG: hypothetical protein FNNCIFGK_01233 [Bacteroidia bacterium]|nr:MAG: hypothetical protein UZ10_BCD003001139 [Bacteroidetes bacterium OLB10]MBV6453989.1 hypothetical protein [Bacteroidia bacterium]
MNWILFGLTKLRMTANNRLIQLNDINKDIHTSAVLTVKVIPLTTTSTDSPL